MGNITIQLTRDGVDGEVEVEFRRGELVGATRDGRPVELTSEETEAAERRYTERLDEERWDGCRGHRSAWGAR